jgi:hypothetical protein
LGDKSYQTITEKQKEEKEEIEKGGLESGGHKDHLNGEVERKCEERTEEVGDEGKY